METELIGACGIYCGACPNYLAFKSQGSHLLMMIGNKNPEDLRCRGCRSGKRNVRAENCNLRKCAKSKGIITSIDCYQYPCVDYLEFYRKLQKKDVLQRKTLVENLKDLSEKGIEYWLKDQEKKWTCDCGHKFSFYEENCIKCGKDLNSFFENKKDKEKYLSLNKE